MLFGYRKGTNRITSKVWLKLEAAEAAAGICEKKPGDVVRTREVKENHPPPEKNITSNRTWEDEVKRLDQRMDELRDQLRLMTVAMTALLEQSASNKGKTDPPQEGAGRSKKAGSMSRHRRSKVQSDNPSLSPDAWLIDRDERGGDHDD